jgi:hypothetical protein
MIRNFWTPAFALGAVLALSGAAGAEDRPVPPASGTTMTLGGKGTAAQAAAEDTELARGYHRGYYGWGGGYGYRGYYGGFNSFYRPYYGGFYSSYSFYRPAFYYSSFYRPYYYSSFYYPTFPVYSSFYGTSFYLGIGGGVTSGAPTVTLGGGFAQPAAQPGRPMAPPVAPDGTFPYDGGPANPVPLPKADPNAIPPANPSNATDLPISGKPKPPATPYKYKAYGEK